MKYRVCLLILGALCFAAAPAFCDVLPQDWELNVNGTDYYPSGGATLSAIPGLDSSGFSSTTGLGTLVLTFNPGSAGSYYVGGYFFDPASVPFYNEYGAVNGSAGSGESWEIGYPEYSGVSLNQGAGTIVDDLANEALSNANAEPGTTSNYLNSCGANGGGSADTTCNDAVGMALGFNFTLGSGQEEVITLNLSSTDPGGFSVEDVHPVDGGNTAQSQVYYSGSAATESVCTSDCTSTVPEPASWYYLLPIGLFVVVVMRRRMARA